MLENKKELFEEIFETYYKKLCGIAFSYVKDIDVAEDVVQDVFTMIWFKMEKFENNSNINGYLYTIVKNKCLDYLKQNNKFNNNVDILDIKDTHIDKSFRFEIDLKKKIETAINGLPKRCRDIFILSRIEGYKYKEIANKLSISDRTVETQIRKASFILRDKLKDYEPIAIVFVFNIFNYLFF